MKILLTDGNGPAFRITLKPADIPSAPAPAAAATRNAREARSRNLAPARDYIGAVMLMGSPKFESVITIVFASSRLIRPALSR